MEVLLRAALIAWLAADPDLIGALNSITEEAPSRTSLPWLAISASAGIDWSTKTESGAEIRLAVELHCRGDQPNTAASLVSTINQRILALPEAQSGFTVSSVLFMRSRVEQRSESTRSILLEYRFRVLAS